MPVTLSQVEPHASAVRRRQGVALLVSAGGWLALSAAAFAQVAGSGGAVPSPRGISFYPNLPQASATMPASPLTSIAPAPSALPAVPASAPTTAPAPVDAAPQAPALAKHAAPIYWRQRTFGVPFRLNPGHVPPTAVLLYVSSDGGRTWPLAEQATPDKQSFLYRAPADGEYGLAIRNINSLGKVVPDEPRTAQMRVVIDTAPPKLEVQATRGPAGVVQLRWQATDAFLRADSLKVEYQCGENRPWRPVELGSQAPSPETDRLLGQTAWLPEQQGPVIIRAAIDDLAGNRVASQAQLAAAPGATAQASNPPPAEAAANPANQPLGIARRTPARPVSQGQNPAGAAPAHASEPAAASQPHAQAWPADEVSQAPLVRKSPQGMSTPVPSVRMASVPRDAAKPEPGVGASQVRFRQHAGAGKRDDLLRVVNSRLFELQYDLAVEPNEVKKVELWATRDGGQTWFLSGPDRDGRSPVFVEVPRKGRYGFRVAADAAGQPVRRPAAGDAPELWVDVDLDPPVVEITSAEPSADEEGRVVVRYRIEDEHPAARGVSLEYASAAEGPWASIATELENTGSYSWQKPSGIGETVFLRLTAEDAGGNITVYTTPSPLRMTAQSPLVRYLSVRPLLPKVLQ